MMMMKFGVGVRTDFRAGTVVAVALLFNSNWGQVAGQPSEAIPLPEYRK
jgi:hypothetical protein